MRRHPVLVLAGLLVVLAAAPTQAQAVPRPFFGIVSEHAFGGRPTERTAVVGHIAQLGAGTVRQTLDWSVIEPTPGKFHWGRYDAWVTVNARRGIRVLPVVFNPPLWASKRPAAGALRGTYPPRSNGEFAAFAALAAKRYGPGGSFWAARSKLRYLPIRKWQIWNEPNLPVYWQPGPNASEYTALLHAASDAIKQVDPGAQILTAGLPKSRLGIPLTTYVRQMIGAGALPFFDTLAVNPYAETATGVLRFLKNMRALLNKTGGRSTALYATEFGWSSQPAPGHFRLGPGGQARAIARTIPLLYRARRSLKLRGIVYFGYRDANVYPGGKDFWGLHTGLRTRANRPKPALRAFRRAISGLR
jgi:hypothetical protein